MSVKVISIFVDKNTKQRYKLGEVLNVTKERYEEIKDFVEIVKDTKNNKETENHSWFSVFLKLGGKNNDR